jgi:predicted O-linked N-acetylglucosamine transferase (SPINDLY family)
MGHLVNQQQLQSAVQQGLTHHQAGRLAQAEEMYRQILSVDPNQPDALHLLGLIAIQSKQHPQAIELISRALELKPDWPEAICNLATALNEAGRRDEAIAGYRRAVALKPDFITAWNSLAGALAANGQPREAIPAYRSAIAVDPNYPDAHNNLGNALRNTGDLAGAIASYERAIELRPDYPQAYNNLAVALQESGRLPKAVAAYQQALRLKPDYLPAKKNMAVALDKLAQQHTAVNQLDEAIELLQLAVSMNPSSPAYPNNLGTVLFDAGRIDEAREAFNAAMKMEPDHASFASAWLSTLHYAAGVEAGTIARHHFEWGDRFGRSSVDSLPRDTGLRPVLTALEDQDLSTPDATGMGQRPMSRQSIETQLSPDQARLPLARQRRIRVGYVSADFRWHPVARFLIPLLEHRDRDVFEVVCYSNVKEADATTGRLQSLTDRWLDASVMGDDALVARIREDEIDILIDLSGHTSGNRLPVFARKPAPVQMTYLGYAGTTGMPAMDYRLTDAHADPIGLTEHLHSEKLIRLPINWCFVEPMNSPPVKVREPGPVRFCSFNHLCKVTDEMLRAWGRILASVPGSQLIVKAGALTSPQTRQSLQARLLAAGIAADRVSVLKPTGDFARHLQAYLTADIALDTYPYHGTTTTCEALWMGLPVIVLEGKTHVSRVGVSLLHNAGLPELIGQSVEDYIAIATSLASDPARLGDLRGSLRERLRQSPLMDAKRFTGEFESALLATLV